VLVDYFVTGKPYAVVLTEQLDAESARDRYPTLQAAYLLSVPQLRGGGRETAAVLQDLLRHDPLAHRRAAVARHVLGDQPGGHQAFLEAARQVIG
jgi:hypothetical protein